MYFCIFTCSSAAEPYFVLFLATCVYVFRYTVYCYNLAFVLQDFNKRNETKPPNWERCDPAALGEGMTDHLKNKPPYALPRENCQYCSASKGVCINRKEP